MLQNGGRGRKVGKLIFLIIMCSSILSAYQVMANDEYAEYVKEVLEEDQPNYDDGYGYDDADAYSYEEKLRQQQEESNRMRQSEEERIAQEMTDRVARERQKAFEAELAKMDADQQKAALKQKRKDSKIVKSVLKSAKNNKHYAVLGMRNWQLSIPPREIRVATYKVTLPGITLKQTSKSDIRKAYRNRALAVHPDKNRDERAQEAFVLVENSASILSDDRLRAAYDEELRLIASQRKQESKKVIMGAVDAVQRFLKQIVWVFRSVLGPFATPVLIIGALLI